MMVDALLTNPLLLFVVAALGCPLGRLRLLRILALATALPAGVGARAGAGAPVGS